MKKFFLSLVLIIGLAQVTLAIPKIELLRNNQVRVQEIIDGRFAGSPVLMTVRGIIPGQKLAAIAHQPVTGVLYGFGYNAANRTGNLYTISQKNFSATLVRQSSVRLTLFEPSGSRLHFLSTVDGSVPQTIRLADKNGSYYLLNAPTASVVSSNEIRNLPVYSHPYSGVTFIDDGTIRNNGIPSNDAQQPEISADVHSTEHDYTLAGNAGTGLATMYPNPATHQTRISLSRIAESQVTVELIDVNGRLASRSIFPPGRQVLSIDVSRIPAGIYSVRVLVGSVLTDRLKLVRREA